MNYISYFKVLVIPAAIIFLVGSFLSACSESDELSSAITRAQAALILEQEPEGHWFSHVETNTFYNCLQILLYYYLEKEEEETTAQRPKKRPPGNSG